MSASAFAATPWLDSLGDWSWPGASRASELLPAPWVPALPRARYAPATRAPVRRIATTRRRRRARLARLGVLALAGATSFTVGAALAPPRAHDLHDLASGAPLVALNPYLASASSPLAERASAQLGIGTLANPLAVPVIARSDRAGSSIASLTYDSQALGARDTVLVYLPPGYRANAARRYPVLYLLHGDDAGAQSFLTLGIQGALDRLIDSHTISPVIAVMLDGAPRTDNWRNSGDMHYESYVTEVQTLADRVLPTIPNRNARAIAGYSMGGYGAMRVALANLRTFSVAESWEGFFNGLSGELAADAPLLRRLPFHAFVYGGASDPIADPAEDAPWAAALRAAGADAEGAVYPGAHTFAPLEAHLAQMLTFAGRALRS